MVEQSLSSIRDEVEAALHMSPYEAVDVLWVALVKVANHMPGKNEHKRIVALVTEMPTDTVRAVLNLPAVDSLLNLDPPLETILAGSHERLEPDAAAQELDSVRRHRVSQPREALIALGAVLKRIRNKRTHGFKTRQGPRDAEILNASCSILKQLCQAAFHTLGDTRMVAEREIKV